jgi:hypothetical protein
MSALREASFAERSRTRRLLAIINRTDELATPKKSARRDFDGSNRA